MERAWLMKKIIVLIVVAVFTIQSQASVVPHDMPTIIALISLHKNIKKAEDAALKKVSTSYVVQTDVTSNTNTFHAARTTLNTKLKNAYSYVVFAGAISSTSVSLYKLIDEYTELSKSASKSFFKKPMCTWYYMETNLKLAKEVKALKVLLATLTASGTNIMLSTMADKLNLIYQIKGKIDSMRNLITRTYWWCKSVFSSGFKMFYIWDVLNSNVTDGIAKGVIDLWCKG